MKDVRKADIEEMISTTEYLSTRYPEFFKINKYVHPVLGERISLVLTTLQKTLDIQLIDNVSIDFEKNIICICSDLGNYTIEKFIKDRTVI